MIFRARKLHVFKALCPVLIEGEKRRSETRVSKVAKALSSSFLIWHMENKLFFIGTFEKEELKVLSPLLLHIPHLPENWEKLN
jgi:hypothetical protein